MNISVFGQSGTGKSTFAATLFSTLYDDFIDGRGVIITDNFADIERVANLMPDEEITHVEVSSKNVAKINFGKLFIESKILAIESVNLISEEIEDLMDKLSENIYTTGKCLVYIDEAHLFLPRTRCSINAERLLRGGRKHAITNIVVTQQLRDLRDVVLKQAHYMIIFKMTQHNEIDMLKAYLDTSLIYDLEKYQCIVLNRLNQNVWIGSSEMLLL